MEPAWGSDRSSLSSFGLDEKRITILVSVLIFNHLSNEIMCQLHSRIIGVTYTGMSGNALSRMRAPWNDINVKMSSFDLDFKNIFCIILTKIKIEILLDNKTNCTKLLQKNHLCSGSGNLEVMAS